MAETPLTGLGTAKKFQDKKILKYQDIFQYIKPCNMVKKCH